MTTLCRQDYNPERPTTDGAPNSERDGDTRLRDQALAQLQTAHRNLNAARAGRGLAPVGRLDEFTACRSKEEAGPLLNWIVKQGQVTGCLDLSVSLRRAFRRWMMVNGVSI